MFFKCTLKVRRALRLGDRDLSTDTEDGVTDFNHWYCNLFYLDRRKCLIWMHGATLFTVLAPGIRQDDIRRFGEIFRSHARSVLTATDGISEADITRLLDDGPDRFAKTDSACVLGSINDRIEACKWQLYDNAYDDIDFDALNYNLNRTPMGAIGYKFASESLKQMLSGGTSISSSIE